MASRLVWKSRLLRQSSLHPIRSYASESKAATQHFPEETFNGAAWRNALIAVAAGLVWYRVDQHITHSGDDKHPVTRWIEYHMTSSAENDKINSANLEGALAAAEYKLFAQEAQRPPIYRMRYPETFERASPRGISAGTSLDLTGVKIRTD
ncbi:hypothetical protein BDB01DRAFT_892976 [Pilobolus umbonatus]|nr:hypothetical protein BDB01DRAFT_892976 [Pilobolus umbonatus]